MSRRLCGTWLCSLLAVLTACLPSRPVAGLLPSQTPAFSHVFIIILENAEYGNIVGNRAAPYINSLAQQYGLATRYYAVSHPSLPNYLALTGGSTFGITSDCTDCFVDAANIADQVEASGRTWRAYMENMPSPCFVGDAGAYAQKHNPFIYYDDIRTNTARCQAHVVPSTQFDADLSSGSAPNYVWITPNLCDDMHDCGVQSADDWLSRVAPGILSSSAFMDGGILFLVWDEGSSNAGCCNGAKGGRIATLVISPLARRGFESTTPETHYSLLRTIENSWGLPPLGAAGRSTPMDEFFGQPG